MRKFPIASGELKAARGKLRKVPSKLKELIEYKNSAWSDEELSFSPSDFPLSSSTEEDSHGMMRSPPSLLLALALTCLLPLALPQLLLLLLSFPLANRVDGF